MADAAGDTTAGRARGLALAITVAVGIAAASAGCRGHFRLGYWTPPEGRPIVGHVAFRGNASVPAGDLRDALQTHSDNLKFGAKPLLDRSDVARDMKRLESFYAARGYFEARVVDYAVEPIDDKAVRVIFRVEEGPATRVRRIELTGLDAPRSDEEAARLGRLREGLRERAAGLGLRAGGVWTEAAYLAVRDALQQDLRDAGFIYAEVRGQTRVARATTQADVLLAAAPGPLTRVASVEVAGNRFVKTSRIRRRIAFAPGDVVEAAALRETERRLAQLNVFFSVAAEPVRVPLADRIPGGAESLDEVRALRWDDAVPVRVTVQEMPTREVGVGIGASVDNERSEAYLRGSFKHRNLFRRVRHLELEAKPALVVLPAFWSPDVVGPGATASARYRHPGFLEEYVDFNLRTAYELDLQRGYRSHTGIGGVGLSRELLPGLTAEIGYQLTIISYFAYTSEDVFTVSQTLGLNFKKLTRVAYLEQVLTLDLRDDPFDARRGGFVQARIHEAYGPLGSDFDYFRLLADGRVYVSPLSWLTLAARAQFGRVFPRAGGDVPLSSRFQGGGASDHRGFGTRGMGDFLCSTRIPNDPACSRKDRVRVGGNVSLLGSFELRTYLPANLGLVAFVDVGDLWATWAARDLKALEVAVGPGLRYITPIGVLRGDFGFLLTAPGRADFTFHFSIGQAF